MYKVHFKLFKSSPFNLFLAALVIIPVFFNSCGEAFKASHLDSATLASLQIKTCQNYQSLYSTPRSISGKSKGGIQSVFSNSKLQLGGPKGLSQKSAREIVPKGTVLSLYIKTQCESPGYFYAELERAGAINSQLKKQALAYTLEKDWEGEALEAQLDNEDCIIGASPYITYEKAAIYNDPRQGGDAPHITQINTLEAHDFFYNPDFGIERSGLTLGDIRVGIIDTGVDYNHEDLSSNILLFNINGQPGYGVDLSQIGGVNQNLPMDIDGHGTHVAGIIAGLANNGLGSFGIMPRKIKIMVLKVFYLDAGKVLSSNQLVMNAIQYAIVNNLKVLNMSLQGTPQNNPNDPLYKEALQEAVNAGIFISAAIGNASASFPQQELTDSGLNILPARYGADIAGMMTVAATNATNDGLANYSFFSSKYAEIAAPGTNIFSTMAAGVRGLSYQRLSGTSMSAPIVAGAAALAYGFLESHGFYPTPELIEELLKDSAAYNPALQGKVQNGGQLDLDLLTQTIVHLFPKTVGKECL